MRKITAGILLALIVILAFPLAVQAQQGGGDGRDPQFEQLIYDRLDAIDPQAVPVFQAATVAMDAQSYAEAKVGFEKVLSLAPDFPDALRRLSYVEDALGDLENAELHARQALAVDPSAVNQSGLARILSEVHDSVKNQEALTLAKNATQTEPQDIYNWYALLLAAVKLQDVDSMNLASNQMVALAPANPTGYYFRGIVAAYNGKWEQSEADLRLAEQYGIPKEEIDRVLTEGGIHTQVMIRRGLYGTGIGLVVWMAGLGLLFLVGSLLSKRTLKAVDREMLSGTFEISSQEQSLRRLYRSVIAVTSVYFYLSIPVLILLVVLLVGGLLYLFLVIGQIPVNLALFILLAGLYTLFAILRSLFARFKETDPGRPVSPEEMPELWQLVREVAQRLNTRPVDEIFLTPGVEAAVMERGRLVNRLNDKGQRVLILGLGTLSGLTQGQLKAILAHEYGHFNNRDTAGGRLAHQVQYSLYQLAYGLASRGLAHWYNPAWLFINGYHRVFLRVTLGASRLQEILADRFAVLAYGIRNMTTGLQHIIRQGLEFNAQVNAEVEQAAAQKRGLHNLYALPAVQEFGKLEQTLSETLSRPSSPYDSHPAPRERLALMQRIRVSGFFGEDPHPAWELIPNAEVLQQEMTQKIERQLKEKNILGRG